MQSWCFYSVAGAKGERAGEPNALDLKVAPSAAPCLRDLQSAFNATPLGGRRGAEWHWRIRVDDDVFGHAWRDVVDGGDRVEVSKVQGEDARCVYARVTDVSLAACALRCKAPPRLRRKEHLAPVPVQRAPLADRPQTRATPPPRPAEASNENVPAARAPPPQRSSAPAPKLSPPPASRSPPPASRSPPRAVPQQEAPQAAPQQDMMMDFGAPAPVVDTNAAVISTKAREHMGADRVAELTRQGKMVWDAVEERHVAVEVVDEGPKRVQLVAIRLDDPIDESKPEAVKVAMRARREALAAAQAEKREFLRAATQRKADEEAAFDLLNVQLGPQLKAWSEEFGKKKNIRALLAGMDKVMWPEAKWQPLSIGDLLLPKNVKRGYYKAARFVHPDKLVDLPPAQRFVGARVFDALSQAYSDFESSGAS
ncbi:DnaJ domain-containing protein [Pelagophyceae sp. CCMP2097]|nr:DnaJ domain-containing protein [Pelagophyceae sp. CCMP2097]